MDSKQYAKLSAREIAAGVRFTTAGLPGGLQLMGRGFDELGLLWIALAYQAGTTHQLACPKIAALE